MLLTTDCIYNMCSLLFLLTCYHSPHSFSCALPALYPYEGLGCLDYEGQLACNLALCSRLLRCVAVRTLDLSAVPLALHPLQPSHTDLGPALSTALCRAR